VPVNDTTVRVAGLKETRAAFKRINDTEVTKALAKANKSAAQIVVDAALPNVPFRSGALAGTVRALGSQTAGNAKAGGSKVPYAAAIHWGTGPRPGLRGPHNIPRRPFLQNAADQHRADIAHEYETAIGHIFDSLQGSA
jgi:HK97 gp10 family phage protein